MTNQNQSYSIGIELFCRFLGLIFLVAFISLWSQLDQLILSDGILPANDYIEHLRGVLTQQKNPPLIPTIFWLHSSDTSLQAFCLLGVLSSICLFLWIRPRLMALGSWFTYLSFFNISQDFLAFQWDILLLESGFICTIAAPWKGTRIIDNKLLRWILWLLLFKLIFSSGVVKLTSGDVTWRDLSALNYHYFTQPIPNPISWYVHQLPHWVHSISTLLMFFIELLVPFLILINPHLRIAAAAIIIVFMTLIFCSGNFAYFNLLTIVICLPAIEDDFWKKIWLFPLFKLEDIKRAQNRFGNLLKASIIVLLMILNLVPLFNLLEHTRAFIPKVLLDLNGQLRFFAIVNSYGLFATMTKTRPEIIIQGSEDGINWIDYEFFYKPGRLDFSLSQVAPLQPRVDWQMWFAALRPDYRYVPWFQKFILKVLQGSEGISRIFKVNPFETKPPKWIRAIVFQYEFTDCKERKDSGNWWRRHSPRIFMPPTRIKDGMSNPDAD